MDCAHLDLSLLRPAQVARSRTEAGASLGRARRRLLAHSAPFRRLSCPCSAATASVATRSSSYASSARSAGSGEGEYDPSRHRGMRCANRRSASGTAVSSVASPAQLGSSGQHTVSPLSAGTSAWDRFGLSRAHLQMPDLRHAGRGRLSCRARFRPLLNPCAFRRRRRAQQIPLYASLNSIVHGQHIVGSCFGKRLAEAQPLRPDLWPLPAREKRA